MILFMCVFTSFCRIYRQSGEIWQHSLSKYLCTYMRFQISALSNDFNDVHFRLINDLHSEDVYSFTSCINSLDAAFKWSGHTCRLWYDIMLIYGKMYSAHLCHFVIRFSAGNLAKLRTRCTDKEYKCTSGNNRTSLSNLLFF